MMDHTDTTLRAAVKALEEVVAPAVDPEDPLAIQQLRLVIDALRFLRDRLDYLHDRYRFEVGHHLALAKSITDDAAACSAASARTLHEAIEAADAVFTRADARDPELRSASAALAAAIRTVVRDAAGTHNEAGRRIEQRIVSATARQVVADRAWHWPQGFDPDPAGAVPLGLAFSETSASR
jgi:hypothetical protein